MISSLWALQIKIHVSSIKIILSMCNSIGVPIKSENTKQPCNVIQGPRIKICANGCRLPQDKLIKLKQLLSVYTKRRKITLKDKQSLIGL
jgi:hypothetical protein